MTEHIEPHQPLTWLAYLILLSLADSRRHGYGIIKEVEARTAGATRIEAGTLYAAIKRLGEQGLLAPAASEPGSRRRNYQLTDLGREALERETERLASLVEVARSKDVIPA